MSDRYTLRLMKDQGPDPQEAVYELRAMKAGTVGYFFYNGSVWFFSPSETKLSVRMLEIALQVTRRLSDSGSIEGEWEWVN